MWYNRAVDQISTEENKVGRVISKFAGRATFDRIDSLIKFLVDAGFAESTLLSACDNVNYIINFPRALVRKKAVCDYFRFYGRDSAALRAIMTKTAMRHPIGISEMDTSMNGSSKKHGSSAKPAPKIKGQVMQIDSFAPPFQNMLLKSDKTDDTAFRGSGGSSHKQKINSMEGYSDFVLVSCSASGFNLLYGRKSKADVHALVISVIQKWNSLFGEGMLREVRAAVDFLQDETIEYIEKQKTDTDGCVVAIKAPSGAKEHCHFTGHIEVSGRWLQVEAQCNWNRLLVLIAKEIISEKNARKLWFAAVVHAREVMLLRPALNDATITRYEAGYGKPPDMAKEVHMPFGTLVVGTMVVSNNPNGPGCVAIYLHALRNSPTSVSAYNCDTKKSVVLYSFKPMVTIPELTQEALDQIRENSSWKPIDSDPVSDNMDDNRTGILDSDRNEVAVTANQCP